MKNIRVFTVLCAIWLGLVVVHSVQMTLNAEGIECITDSVCLSTKNDMLMLACLQASFIVFLIIIARITLLFMLFAISKGFGVYLGGGLMMVLGLTGVAILFSVTATEEIVNFIHIIVVGCFLVLFGAFMIFKTWQKRHRN